MNIYRDLYRMATPSTDFDSLIASGETKKERWFMNYYLPEEKITKTIEEHRKKYKLTASEMKTINFEIYLGCSPCSNKETWAKK